jgi:hypothetical protein
VAFDGVGTQPFSPLGWPMERRFWRAEFGLDTSASTDITPLPRINLSVATFNEWGQLYTCASDITALRSSLVGGGPNPALDAATFVTHLHLPEGSTLAAGSPIGDRIGAGVRLVDLDDATGGTLVIDSITVTSFPESLLP